MYIKISFPEFCQRLLIQYQIESFVNYILIIVIYRYRLFKRINIFMIEISGLQERYPSKFKNLGYRWVPGTEEILEVGYRWVPGTEEILKDGTSQIKNKLKKSLKTPFLFFCNKTFLLQ